MVLRSWPALHEQGKGLSAAGGVCDVWSLDAVVQVSRVRRLGGESFWVGARADACMRPLEQERALVRSIAPHTMDGVILRFSRRDEM